MVSCSRNKGVFTMKKVFIIVTAFLISFSVALQADEIKEKKNPFESYHNRMAKIKEKIGKMDAKKDAKKIQKEEEKLAKEQEKLQKAAKKLTSPL